MHDIFIITFVHFYAIISIKKKSIGGQMQIRERVFGAFERKSPRGFSRDNPVSVYGFIG